MSESKVRALVVEELGKLRAKVLERYGFAPVPHVGYDLRGRVIGKASGWRAILVNLPAALEMGEAYREIVGHEYAHIIHNWIAYNHPKDPLICGDLDSSHGAGWKSVMMFLGLNPRRCYSAEVGVKLAEAKVFGKTYQYICPGHPGKVYHFSQRRHNNVVLRGFRYTCTCGRYLVQKEE